MHDWYNLKKKNIKSLFGFCIHWWPLFKCDGVDHDRVFGKNQHVATRFIWLLNQPLWQLPPFNHLGITIQYSPLFKAPSFRVTKHIHLLNGQDTVLSHLHRMAFPSEPPLFYHLPEALTCGLSRFAKDGLGNIWGQGSYPDFMRHVRDFLSNSKVHHNFITRQKGIKNWRTLLLHSGVLVHSRSH